MNWKSSFLMASALAVVFSVPTLARGDAGIAGIWQGLLTVPGAKLRIVSHVAQAPDKTLTATMDSPDQGATGIKVDTVTFAGGSFHAYSAAVRGSYDGKLETDSLVGTWRQSDMDFPLVLKKIEKVEVPNRPQEPKPPYPYLAEDVTYPNKAAGITLAGTLTSPEGKGPLPAVILITGSGPQDRNEEIFGHKPFLVLADYLTRRGIAVLRSDDRGVGKSGGSMKNSTSLDFKGDVVAALDYLKTRKEIDPKRIGLLGHSEGGLIAPMVAVDRPDVAFIVLLAGPGVPGDEILVGQTRVMTKARGASDSAVALSVAVQRKVPELVKVESDTHALADKIRALVTDAVAATPKADLQSTDTARAVVEATIQQSLSPWLKFFVSYDPAPTLSRVKCPTLAVFGGKDVQVDPRLNLPPLEKALRSGGNRDVTVKELPGLNHLLQTAETGMPDEYAHIEETMSPTALQLIGDWIVEHTKK